MLVIAVAWMVRLFAAGAKRRRAREGQESIPAPVPQRARPSEGARPSERTPPPDRDRRSEPSRAGRAADLLRELGLDLEEEPVPAAPVAPAPAPSAPPPPTLPPVPALSSRVRVSKKPQQVPPLPPPKAAAAELAGARPSSGRLRSRVLRDLQGGVPSLARAVVLAEILGPPVGLKQGASRPGTRSPG